MDSLSKSKTARGDEVPLFEVTKEVVVGTVYDGAGEHSPQEAAMLIIARDMDDGKYRFPLENGSLAVVDITIETM